MITGIKMYGVLVRDRETGRGYGLHPECLGKLRDLVRESGYVGERFAEMGPTVDASTTCNYGTCGRPLSEAAA